MPLRDRVEAHCERLVAEFTGCAEFKALEHGAASLEEYDQFLSSVVRSHLKAPQVLAFLYSLAPPEAAPSLLHTMLEELGIEDASGVAHPSMLRELARGAGLGPLLPELEGQAAADIRQVVVEPLLYGTLKEVCLAALCEVVAFEYMLSRTARRLATALAAHRGLTPETLTWFTHHSEVDVRHAEQGLDDLVAYADYYEISDDEAFTICEMALRENVFVKRYFGELALGRARPVIETFEA